MTEPDPGAVDDRFTTVVPETTLQRLRRFGAELAQADDASEESDDGSGV